MMQRNPEPLLWLLFLIAVVAMAMLLSMPEAWQVTP